MQNIILHGLNHKGVNLWGCAHNPLRLGLRSTIEFKFIISSPILADQLTILSKAQQFHDPNHPPNGKIQGTLQ